MKRWRIVQYHPEDRFEPDDEVADEIREKLRGIELSITNFSPRDQFSSLNQLFLERRRLQIELSVRLYGE